MKFDQYLSGMVELRVPPERTEELLQQITAAGIHLHHIQRQEDGLYLWILLDDFAILQRMLREQRCSFHVQQRRGLPFSVSRIKRRKGLWMGAFLCFALLYLLFSFIWGYEVSGNEQYSDAHMIALVKEYGLLPGSRIDKFDYDAIEQQMVLDHPQFAWIRLQPNGTTLTITVKERLPDKKQQQQEGSIIAGADGRITELLVFRGTPQVTRGQWVKKGQVLIGGWDYPDRQRNSNGEFAPSGTPYTVKAKGVIYGEQERSVIGSCSLEERMLQSTGNIKKQIALVWKGHELILHGPKTSPYPYSCQQIKTTRLLGWQQFELPVYVRTTIFEEKQIEQRSYTKEEAYTMAVERARKRLQEQMPKGSRFIRESAGICPSDQQNVVQAEVVWTIEANLAEVKQTQLPEAELSAEQNEQQTEQAAEGQ